MGLYPTLPGQSDLSKLFDKLNGTIDSKAKWSKDLFNNSLYNLGNEAGKLYNENLAPIVKGRIDSIERAGRDAFDKATKTMNTIAEDVKRKAIDATKNVVNR